MGNEVGAFAPSLDNRKRSHFMSGISDIPAAKKAKIAPDIRIQKWYWKDNNGTFKPTYDTVSPILSNMSIGETKIMTLHNTKYSMFKLTNYQCTQQNMETNVCRELRLESAGFCYQDMDGIFKPYSDSISDQISKIKIGSSFTFSVENRKYEITLKSTYDGQQKNLQTTTVRHIKWFANKYDPTLSIMKKSVPKLSITGTHASKWYKMNPDGVFEPIIDDLSQQICAIKIGETKSVSFKSQTYITTKISCNKCILMHVETNTKTELRCEEYGWCYQDMDGLFKPFSDDINTKMLFVNIGNSITFSLKNNNKYKVTKLSTDSGKQKNLSTGTERHVKYGLKFQTIKDFDEKKEKIKKIKYKRKEKKDKNKIYDAEHAVIKTLFFTTLSASKYKITELKCISNENYVNVYESILDAKCKTSKLKPSDMEQFLWHGIRSDSDNVLQKILKNGFDRSYNKVGKFGKGTYFAKHAAYSVEGGYCGKGNDDIYFILLCRVIIGEYTNGQRDVKTIPTKPDGLEYDSLVNNKDNPTIFVSWRDYHAIPYYLVKFKQLT